MWRHWMPVATAGLGLLVVFVPLDTLLSIAQRASPSGALLPKTVLLIQALRVVLPSLGAMLGCWLVLPVKLAKAVSRCVSRVLDAPWAPLAVVVVGVLVRLVWLLVYPTQPYADSQWYLDSATRLAQGYGYALDTSGGTPTAAWPPGYPWLLSILFRLVGPGQRVALALNVPLGGLSIWLTFALGARWYSRRVAVLASLAIALLPGLVVYTSLINSDILFLCLALAALAIASQGGDRRAFWWQAVALGVLLAAAGLTRSLGMALLPVAALTRYAASGRPHFARTLRWTMLAGVTMALCILPWSIRNYHAFGRPVLISTNGGLNFWMGNNPGAGGAYYGPSDPDLNPLLAFAGDELALDEAGYRFGLEFVRAHPRRVVALWPAKVFYLYNSNDGGVYWNQRSALRPLQFGTGPEAYWLTNLIHALLLALVAMGIADLVFARQRLTRWLPVIFVLWWTLLHLPFFGADRFGLPALPMFAMLGASGLLLLLHRPEAEAPDR